jgi:drug/metabolite transporter (DMT)-like permease
LALSPGLIYDKDMPEWIYHIYSFLAINTYRQAKRVVRIVIGFTLLIIGIALIVLPGPASVVIPLALVVLAGEFVWARRLLHKFHQGYSTGVDSIKRMRKYFRR